MDHRTSESRPWGSFASLAPALGLAALMVGCGGGETSNATPESAIASPRSAIEANPSSARPSPPAVGETKEASQPAATKDAEKPAPAQPSAKAEASKADEASKEAHKP